MGMKPAVLCTALTAAFAAVGVFAESAKATFTNPIWEKDAPDPFVTYDAETGYSYGLRTNVRGVELFRSRQAATIFSGGDSKTMWRPNAGDGVLSDIWAPEMYKAPDGKWYVYASGNVATNGWKVRIFALQSKTVDPFDGFVFKGIPDPDMQAIDPTVWIAPDGRRYMVYSFMVKGGQRLGIRPFATPWTYAGPNVEIARAELPWEVTWAKQRIVEGAFMLRRGKRSYIIYSANGCWNDDYALGVLEFMGGDPMNAVNWKKHQSPILVKGNGVFGPGHASFFMSPDGAETWCAYHGLVAHNEHHKPAVRKPNLQKVKWTDDDYPILGVPTLRGVPIAAPSGEMKSFANRRVELSRQPGSRMEELGAARVRPL